VHARHDFQIVVGEQQRHEFVLFHADAMLAGDGASSIDAILKNHAAGLVRALHLVRIAHIKQDARMQVAVPGVEDVADLQLALLGHALDVAQHLGNVAARDDAILGVVGRRQASEGSERRLATLPQQLALRIVGGAPDLARTVTLANRAHGIGLVGHGLAQSFQLNQQHRAGIHRVAGMGRFLDAAQRLAVQHLQRDRRDALRSDGGNRIGRIVDGVENREQRFDSFGDLGELDRNRGYDRHRAFGSDEQAGQIVAAGIHGLATHVRDAAVGQHHLEPGNVVHGDAMRQSVRAAGIFRDVAADGGGALARWVGREVQPVLRHGGRQVRVHHSRLHHGAAVGDVDFQNRCHAREHQHDAAGARNGAAAQTGSRSPGHQRHIHARGGPGDLRYLLGCAGKYDHFRRTGG
jgi:hypothetical protein